ncbi:GNAT family N-acetyltransferase [soil metagenome]
MELTWLDPEEFADRDVAGAVSCLEAARVEDCPDELGETVAGRVASWRHGWDGDRPVTALARVDRGRVAGVLQVSFPSWDNTHLGSVDVVVDPLARRRGLGRRLFEAGVERIRAHGRTLVLTDCFDLPASVAFATAMGLDRVSEEVRRRQDLADLDWTGLDLAYADARGRARDYDLVPVFGATPQDMITDVATMTEAINDAPTDDLDVEDEVFTPERIRAFEAAQLAHDRRLYRLIARERSTGVLAGHTMVAVESDRPWHAWQYDTSVLRAHRGHRLGLLLKIAMLRWLAEDEPQLRTLDTWNAASNAHMIEVNEVLGYRIVATGIG